MCNLALVVNRGDTFTKRNVEPKKEQSLLAGANNGPIKRGALYMYKTIVIDCQNIATEVSCSDCFAYRKCEMTKQKPNPK